MPKSFRIIALCLGLMLMPKLCAPRANWAP